jgi:hypothetical protein
MQAIAVTQTAAMTPARSMEATARMTAIAQPPTTAGIQAIARLKATTGPPTQWECQEKQGCLQKYCTCSVASNSMQGGQHQNGYN